MKKIALCVATYEHADIVDDVLSRCAEDYFRCGIDIYYYDSSANDETQRVIQKYIEQGYNNLYYLAVEADFDEKIELIYSGYGLKEEYDYIWPSKDRSFCPMQTLEKVLEAVEENDDFVMLGIMNSVPANISIYKDAKEFYHDWAWLATSLDVLLYKYSTTLKGYNSEEFNLRFFGRYMDSWRVYMYVFSRLLEIQDCRVRVLFGEGVKIYNSVLGKSTWDQKTFTIWKDDWIVANNNLSQYYEEYKGEIIKRVASLPWIMGSIERLEQLHKMGVLIPEKLEEIEVNWEKVSDIPIEVVRKIAWGIYDPFHDMEVMENVGSEMMDLLVSVHKLVSEGKMKTEQVPWQDIKIYIKGIFDSKYSKKCRCKDVFEGTLQDIVLMGVTAKPNEAKKILQLLVSLLFVLEN